MQHPSPSIEVEQYLGQLRDTKGLSAELKVSRDYILAMRNHGFRMPGGKATIRMARNFIETCEEFMVRERRPASPPQPGASGDRSHEPPPKRGPRRPSSDSQKTRPHTTG